MKKRSFIVNKEGEFAFFTICYQVYQHSTVAQLRSSYDNFQRLLVYYKKKRGLLMWTARLIALIFV